MAQNRPFDPTSKTPNTTAINYSVDQKFGGSNGFSPGSSFKPIILAEWLDSGHGLNQVVPGQKKEFDMTKWKASCLGGNAFHWQVEGRQRRGVGGAADVRSHCHQALGQHGVRGDLLRVGPLRRA